MGKTSLHSAKSAPPGFSPLDISDLKVWLDTSDSTTITKDGSDRVSEWDDKSGNGHNQAQATANRQPLWRNSNRNGLDTIDFSKSTTDRLMVQASSFTSINQPITVFTACELPQIQVLGNETIYSGLSSTGVQLSTEQSSEGGLGVPYIRAGASLYASNSTGSDSWGTSFALFDGVNSELEINGLNVATGNAGNDGTTGLTVGAQYNTASFLDKIIGEIIMYDKEVSGDEKANLMTYLTNRWDL